MISSSDALFSASHRGKHRIYIGMAPGVGKTYRMLQDAKALKQEGIDVVIGLLETHNREETAQQAEGLERIPLSAVNYLDKRLKEMNVEEILARSPQLVLVDELAHTNVPGSVRSKRYQDVEYILESGIDVFSTVNIQHLESLKDVVTKITGVVVRERIPDRLLDEADEVVVVDITPEILQERLQDGKIYDVHKIEQSLSNFFQYRNLISLRELALREVADNLEDVTEDELGTTGFNSIQERILVTISTNPHSSRLIRRGARLVSQLKGKLYVLFVSHPERFLTKEESLYIEMCERLTKELGGEFLRLSNPDVVKAIAQIAQEYYITQIVIGQTQQSRWKLFLYGSIIQRLIRQIKDIDLHIIAT